MKKRETIKCYNIRSSISALYKRNTHACKKANGRRSYDFQKIRKGVVVEGHGLFGDTAKCTGEGEEKRQ